MTWRPFTRGPGCTGGNVRCPPRSRRRPPARTFLGKRDLVDQQRIFELPDHQADPRARAPGWSTWSGFGNTARTMTLPVAGSTVLPAKSTSPRCKYCRPPVTRGWPRATRRRHPAPATRAVAASTVAAGEAHLDGVELKVTVVSSVPPETRLPSVKRLESRHAGDRRAYCRVAKIEPGLRYPGLGHGLARLRKFAVGKRLVALSRTDRACSNSH
jgi:hypothetical protein